jgi:hypothetical protein
MIGMTLDYLNRLDASHYERLNNVTSNPYENSTAAVFELQSEIAEQSHQLAKVVEANLAAAENRDIVGGIVDRLV